MPDPKLTKPWHGVPREMIDWHPTVNEDACIGCGRLVYRFDFARKKAVVADPLKTVQAVLNVLLQKGVPHERILVDSFGA